MIHHSTISIAFLRVRINAGLISPGLIHTAVDGLPALDKQAATDALGADQDRGLAYMGCPAPRADGSCPGHEEV